MAKMLLTTILCPVIGIAFAGCASVGQFPSLAKRPFEDNRPVAVAAAVVPAPSDLDAVARVSSFVAQARLGRAPFDDSYRRAVSAVHSVGAQGSESWIAAQVAVSRIEPLREPASVALGNISDERRKLAAAPLASVDQAALDAAFAEVEMIVLDQSGKVTALQEALRTR